MLRLKTKKGRILFALGCCCFAAAFALWIYNLYITKQAGNISKVLSDNFTQLLAEAERAEDEEYANDPALNNAEESDAVQMEVFRIEGYDIVGQLHIPNTEINLAVIAEWSYPNLKVAPCRYSGTPTDKLVLLAHNYDTHFGALDTLELGDSVYFMDVGGTIYEYEVLRTEEWNTDQLEQILGGEDWDLTLFTCTYGGKSRVVVRCALMNITEADA